ncbi:MAG: hypothetical protein OQK82_02265 [Candidatus Pacearchaeota archaeon]|nr:hypothetical protein [Candidatus Pacearchaeota archaeon]
MPKYRIYTNYPRNFDPEVEGITIDSIIENSKGYISHGIPFDNEGNMIINIETSGELDREWIVGQLEEELGDYDLENPIIKDIQKVL